jgi:hypothetical protein
MRSCIIGPKNARVLWQPCHRACRLTTHDLLVLSNSRVRDGVMDFFSSMSAQNQLFWKSDGSVLIDIH